MPAHLDLVSAVEILAGLAGVYGAVLSTVVWRGQHRYARPKIEVSIRLRVISSKPMGEPDHRKSFHFELVAANVGGSTAYVERPTLAVVFQSYHFEMPWRSRGGSSFPATLEPGQGASDLILAADVADFFATQNPRRAFPLVAEFRDQVGGLHKSEPLDFDPEDLSLWPPATGSDGSEENED